MVFRMHSSRLHFYDPSEEAYTFIETVENNKLPFTKRQLAGAEKTRALYSSLGFPSVKDFIWILQSNQLKYCPVSVVDFDITQKILGPNVSTLQG